MKKQKLVFGVLILLFQLIQAQPFKARSVTYSGTSDPGALAPGYSVHEDKYDIRFYYIDIETSITSNYINGSALIKADRQAASIDTFVLELSSKLHVDSVFINSRKVENPLQVNNLVKIVLAPSERTAANYDAKIYYKGSSGSAGFFSGLTNATASDWNRKITYTLSEPFLASDWFPVKQDLTDKADSVWVFITVPQNLKAGSNGILTKINTLENGRKRYEWKSKYPIAFYLISFTVGEFLEYNFYAKINEQDSVFVQNYIYDSPGIMEAYKKEIDYTAPLLKLYSEKFGKYPFASEKYGHCMAPLGGGMEHQTMTTLSSFSFGLIAHEMAHQWFGDYVTCGSWQDIWINEGFASYAEYIARENLISAEDARKWLIQAQNSAINSPNGSVYLSYNESRNSSRIFNSNLSYKKGAAIIHMLRFEINNDALFFEILRDFINTYGNKTATGEDFRKIVEKHTSENYLWFFDQWYYGKGHPVMVVTWRQIGDSIQFNFSQTARPTGGYYKTHMEYQINYKDGNSNKIKLLHTSGNETYSFYVDREVTSVSMDPNSNVLKNGIIFTYVDHSKVYTVNPNPFKNNIKIIFNNGYKERQISLLSLNGKTNFNKTISSDIFQTDLSYLKPGLYILNVVEDGVKYSEKLVKE